MIMWLHVMTSRSPFIAQYSAKAQTRPMEHDGIRSVKYQGSLLFCTAVSADGPVECIYDRQHATPNSKG
jgi:hypothetical protein